MLEGGPLEKKEGSDISRTGKGFAAEPILDGLLAVLKFVFLFLPGAVVIHLGMIITGMMALHGYWSGGMILEHIGSMITGIFLVMLGIGKWSDLRYLRVPVMLLLSSSIFAIIYAAVGSFIPGGFGVTYVWSTFPLTLALGFLVKQRIDRSFPDTDS